MTVSVQKISRGGVQIPSQKVNTFLDSVFSRPSSVVLGYQINISRGGVHTPSQKVNTVLDSEFSRPSSEVLGSQMSMKLATQNFCALITLDLDGR